MPPQTPVGRIESLESRVTVLEQLPEKFDALALQISQLREEIHGEFSALRTEIRAGDEESRRHARMLHEELISRLALIEEGRRPRKRADTRGDPQ